MLCMHAQQLHPMAQSAWTPLTIIEFSCLTSVSQLSPQMVHVLAPSELPARQFTFLLEG